MYFVDFLERRLDLILLRANFVLSVKNAQQLILHGHVFINSQRIQKKKFFSKKG
jgi:ribosomal protein S4